MTRLLPLIAPSVPQVPIAAYRMFPLVGPIIVVARKHGRVHLLTIPRYYTDVSMV